MKVLAYHGKPAEKSALMKRMRAHREADRLVQGATGQGGKGCAVWCSVGEYRHDLAPERLGWPEWLARLYDTIFEGLPQGEAADFAIALPASIKAGVDLEKAWGPITVARMERNLAVLAKLPGAPYKPAVVDAVKAVAELATSDPARRQKKKWESAAWSAWSAAQSAAAWSAWSAAQSAAAWSAAAAAAWSAESAAAAAAVRSAESAAARHDASRAEASSLIAAVKSLKKEEA